VSEVLADGPLQRKTHVGGRSLDRIIARMTTLPERLKLLPNLIVVAEAIAHMHAERVVHGDLKPESIVVGPFGETVITGWGQATELAAPPDERVDIRALGAILERVLGGGALPLPPDTPRKLVAIIQRAQDPDHYPDAAELAASLRGWRDQQSAPQRRHRSVVAMILVILVVLAAIGLWDRCFGA
jgi:serine/threonine protein kinase